jgi:hypothetical protein
MLTETSVMSAKTELVVSAATGGSVAALRARGPLWVRLSTGLSGAAVSYFVTPIAAPIAEAAMEWAMQWAFSARLDLEPASVPARPGSCLGQSAWSSCSSRSTSCAATDRLPAS